MKIHPMPPLNSLIAFEAAARHLSFTLAATELNVTQGAISRQVRHLEDYLGKPLFERGIRTVHLTPTGARYYDTVRDSLLHLARSTDEVRHWRGDQQVTVVTSTALAAHWLLPRVPAFKSRFEDIDLRIVADDQVRDFARLDCDLALYYCGKPPRDMRVTPLFAEEVFPVCSPAYLERHPQLADAAGLADCTWLWLEATQRDWIGWPEWLVRLGLGGVTPRQRININSYSLLLQSALTGQGVALGWHQLVDDHLLTGALVRPNGLSLKTEGSFCLLERPGACSPRQSVRQFRQWLTESV
jgi:DNA-binding transcriptional LysR family regulator